MQVISTDTAAAPLGHYEQGIKSNGLIFVSMQLPVHPQQEPDASLGVEAQARQVLANIVGIVEAGGSCLDKIVKMTVYVADIESWSIVNAVYTEVFGDHKPARSVIQVAGLHLGYKVAMEAVAVV